MIRTDLILHFLAGFLIATIATAFLPLCTGIVLATVIGLGKELFDKFIRKQMFDFKDFILTFGGGFLGLWIDIVKFGY